MQDDAFMGQYGDSSVMRVSQPSGDVMFHGLLILVLCITHAEIIVIVGVDSVEGGANGPRSKIYPTLQGIKSYVTG